MAKKSELTGAKRVAAADLRKVVADIARHKENASENNGLAGQATKLAIERHNLDAKALNIVTSLSKKDAAKAQVTALNVLVYAVKLGIFDQIDAFSDYLAEAKELLDKVVEGEAAEEPKKSKADPAMSTILSGGAPH